MINASLWTMTELLERDPVEKFSRDEMKIFSEYGRVLHVNRNSILLKQGIIPDGLLYIIDGQIKHTTVNANGDELYVYIAYSGEWIGTSCLNNSPSLLNGKATCDSTIYYLPKTVIKDVFMMRPRTMEYFINILVSYTHRCTIRLLNVAALPAERLVPYIILEHYQRSLEAKISEPSVICVTQNELASACGKSLRTVTRVLRCLVKHECIEIKYANIIIINLDILKRMASLDGIFGVMI